MNGQHTAPGRQVARRAYLPAARNRISGEYLRVLDSIGLLELEAERLHSQLVWLTAQLDEGIVCMDAGELDWELNQR